jgi:hypothetical protein
VLACLVFVRANPFVTVLEIAACLGLLAILARFLAGGRLAAVGLAAIPWTVVAVPLVSLVRAPGVLRAAVAVGGAGPPGRWRALPVVRGLLLALPVVAVFAAMLVAADLVFEHYVQALLDLDWLPDVAEWAWRAVIVAGTTVVLAGAFDLALGRQRSASSATEARDATASRSGHPGAANAGLGAGGAVPDLPVRLPPVLGAIEASTVLASVDLLFLAFLWIQAAYLFGGRANIGLDGFTYAEYARHGFLELLFVAALSLALIETLHGLARRTTDLAHRWFNGLATLQVALVLVIGSSALHRLMLYEVAYGYTRTRLAAHVFLLWLGAVLVWRAITLWWRPDRFAAGALVAALGFAVTLGALNPDALIARRNVERYQQTGDLDAIYLGRLGADAVPVLVDALADLPPDLGESLAHDLRSRAERLAGDEWLQSWPAFHLARHRARERLEELPADLSARP